MKRLMLCALLLAAPAAAEFTSQEKTEILKIVTARGAIGATFKPLGDSIRDCIDPAKLPNCNHTSARPIYYAAILESMDAEVQCHEAMRHLLNSTAQGFGSMTREQIVAQGIVDVGQCSGEMDAYANALDAASQASGDSALSVQAGLVRNARPTSFNGSLSYSSYETAHVPRDVGPHGHFVASQQHLELLSRKNLEWIADVAAFYGQVEVWPDSANIDIREVIRYWMAPVRLIPRMWALDFGVATPGDATSIQADVDGSSGMRGFDFWRGARQEIHWNGNPHLPPSFRGEVFDGGVISNYALAMAEFPKAVKKALAVNSTAEVASWYEGSKSGADASIKARKSSYMLTQFGEDMGKALEEGGLWELSLFGFYFQPPSLPPNFCPEGSVCQASGGESGVTCGTGTHLVGTECLPDTVEPCPSGESCLPPPQPCPAQSVNFLSITPGGQINAQCVEP